jgi:exosortase
MSTAAAKPNVQVRNPPELHAISSRDELRAYGVLVGILAWWIYDLHFQWSAVPEYHFGWIVGMLTLYLGFDRWETRPGSDKTAPWSVVAPLVLAGGLLVVVGRLYEIGIARTFAASFFASLGCLCFSAAILLQGCGVRTFKHFLFPLLFLFVAVPIPKIVWNPIVFGLQTLITAIDVELLKILGIPASQQGTTIRLSNCVVGVDEACSGVRSLQSGIMAALFVGDLTLRRPLARVGLVVCGIGLALSGNLVRSLLLSLAAVHGGKAALEQVHDTAGWSILALTAAGVALCSWLFHHFEKVQPSMAPATWDSNEVSSAHVPGKWLLAVVAASFLAALSGAWAWFNLGARAAPVRYAFQLHNPVLGYTFKPDPVPESAIESLETTNLLNGRFIGDNEEIIAFAANWGPEADLNVVHHTPDICWVGVGWRSLDIGQPKTVSLLLNGKEMPFECRVFISPNGLSKQLVIWCTLLGGVVLDEGLRWSTEQAGMTAKSRSTDAGRRVAMNHFVAVLKDRIPADRRKQFLRLSSSFAGDHWEAGLKRLESFITHFVDMRSIG